MRTAALVQVQVKDQHDLEAPIGYSVLGVAKACAFDLPNAHFRWCSQVFGNASRPINCRDLVLASPFKGRPPDGYMELSQFYT
jgi:hypothetical protein